MNTKEAVAQLADYTADEIAELLRLAGKHGDPYNARQCPIANYLNDVVGEDHTVGPSNIIGPTLNDDINYLPFGVRDFINKFDNGWYEDLVC